MTTILSTQFRLLARPVGWPTAEHVERFHEALPELTSGEVRVRNTFLSVDPYMRGRMNDQKSYVPPFGLGESLTGGAVGRVIESTEATLPVGTLVVHQLGWRDIAQAPARAFTAVPEPTGVSESVYLGILGLTGLTAYVGLTTIAPVSEGDTVFISGAAGAVGSAAGQIARILGATRVIGSAGTDAKVARLEEHYGFDVAFNYTHGPVREALTQAAPEGINVYFDNVGGEHLEAALDALNRHGRVALCGAISLYNSVERPEGPRNMSNLITQSLTLRGFTVGEHGDARDEFTSLMLGWLQRGEVTFEETIVDGVDNTFEAFLEMLRGANTGKMLVRVS